jgi:predicted TIM-barrel fold metal-dependent hydrolase
MTNPTNELTRLPIVDAHHHFWDFDALDYPWLKPGEESHFFLGDPTPLRRRFLPPEYAKETAEHNVVATVHVEAECNRSLQVEETKWLTELNARYGKPNALVAHAWLDTETTEQVLHAHKAYPLVRGIRSKPVTSASPSESVAGAPRSMQDPQWLAGFRLLAELDLSWDLRVPYWHLTEAAAVVEAHPETRVVVNHTGFPWDRSPAGLTLWREGMEALARLPSVHVKLSCVCVPGTPWTEDAHRAVVLETIERFGVERCMFATNIPPDTIQVDANTMLHAYKAMVQDFAPSDQRALFHDNAARFYRLELDC